MTKTAPSSGRREHQVLAGIVVETVHAKKGDPVSIAVKGELVLPLERGSMADLNVRAIIRAARDAGHELPPLDRFYFAAGQVFYKDLKLEEVRLSGAVLTETVGEDGETRKDFEPWSTPHLPWVHVGVKDAHERAEPLENVNGIDRRPTSWWGVTLDPRDERRTHLSARAFDLNCNGENIPGKLDGQSSAAAIPLNDMGLPGERVPHVAFLWDLSANAPPRDEETKPPPPTEEVPPVQAMTMPLAFGRTLADKDAIDMVRHVHAVRLPAKGWTRLHRWLELVAEEIQRIKDEEGEAAFDAVENGRGPLLKRRWRGSEEIPSLTAEAEKALKIRHGLGKGFRYLDPDTGEEYLQRLFQVGSGFLEVGLSWYGMAGPWVEDWRKERREEEEPKQRSLFEVLDEAAKRSIGRRLPSAQAFDDAQRIMELALGQVGRQAQNPIPVPAITLRVLLKIEKDKDWKKRIERALNALRHCSFRLDSFGVSGQAKGYGSFLGEWWYLGAGTGHHGAGDYFLHVQPGFVGCLSVFESGKSKLPGGTEAIRLDFSKRLSREEEKNLGWKLSDQERKNKPEGWTPPRFVNFDAGQAFYNEAAGLTSTQERLVHFVEHELTLNRDTVSKHIGNYGKRRILKMKKDAPDANEPRAYGREECPVLPEGKRFHGALGHFRASPEIGRTLRGTSRRAGRTGGAHAGGLLHEMGHYLPPGRAEAERARIVRHALEDMKAVVEDYLGGIVVVKVGSDRVKTSGRGKWWRLPEAAALQERELLERCRFFFFLPEDWREKRERKWEEHQEERAKKGETPKAWKVTKDPAEAERSRLALRQEARVLAMPKDGMPGLVDFAPVRPEETAAPSSFPPATFDANGAELRHRLRAARLERGLTLAQIGTLFGVTHGAVSRWETGTEPDAEGKVRGKPIPAELVPLVERWVQEGASPTAEELASRRSSRKGVNPKTGKPWKPGRKPGPEAPPED